jgi:hypothetical protein
MKACSLFLEPKDINGYFKAVIIKVLELTMQQA